MKFLKIIPVLALFVAGTTVASEDIVAKRQQLMKQLGGIGKQLNDGVDLATANKLGGDIQKITAELKNSFPTGSSEDDKTATKTGAKAKIWAEKANVDAIFDKLSQSGASLAGAKSDDEAKNIAKAIGPNTCKVCHDTYRTKL